MHNLFSFLKYLFNPNPDIESRMIVQVIDVHKEFTKTEYTSLVMRLFENFLGILWACANIVISISGFGFNENVLP